jgi:hypothetical protein
MLWWLFGWNDKERIKKHEKAEIERNRLEHQKFLICKQIATSKINLKKTGLIKEPEMKVETLPNIRKYNRKYKSKPIEIPRKNTYEILENIESEQEW